MLCDLSRGLSVLSHLTKSFLLPTKAALDPCYRAAMPRSQFGCVAGGGTDLAHHLILELIGYARQNELCIFILFLDLIKAFDKVLRELVFGFPLHLRERKEKSSTFSASGFARETQIGF